DDHLAWLSQANHIFHRLQIKSNYKDYAIIDEVYFWIQILEPTQTPPNGYLYVCPFKDLQTGPMSFRWPKCPAYWSLDPSGAERLSRDEATYLGFPSIELETQVYPRFWDASVYAGLHKFHEGKGFDPDSQDVARHLGHPLFQLSCAKDEQFAHVDEVLNAETETEGTFTATAEGDDEDGSHPEDGEVSGVKTEREHSSMATNEVEDGDGSAMKDADGEIHEVEAESEGSSPATNEDADRNKHTPQDEYASLDLATNIESVPQLRAWKAVIFVKFALILALSFQSLYECGQAILSQRDI
ncbi:hypothetical protein B0H11DRAFT_2384607, partial [Mycena galericulata]